MMMDAATANELRRNVIYNTAEQDARDMTDDALIVAHKEYIARDNELLAAFPAARGLVDDPFWSYIKHELRKRGLL